MNQKRQYQTYTKAFKEEAVALVNDQGYTVPEAALSLRITLSIPHKKAFRTVRLQL